MLKKILIADGSPEYRRALTDALSHRGSIRSCADGDQALELLRSYRPDYLILDLMLSGFDGITVIKQAQKEGILPPTVVTSLFISQAVSFTLTRLGIDYAIRKPCRIEAIVSCLEDLEMTGPSAVIQLPSPQGTVAGVLMDLGFSINHSGYRYCRDAIVMLVREPGLQVTKSVYPQIARQSNCFAASVEKCIRDAIAAAWATGDRKVWARYFPGPNGQPHRPSNRVFLSTIAEILTQSGRIAL